MEHPSVERRCASRTIDLVLRVNSFIEEGGLRTLMLVAIQYKSPDRSAR